VATIFLHALARLRGQILGWGLALFLMGALAVVRYDLMRENRELIRQLLQGSLGQFVRMFGDVDKLTTPGGFLSLAFFSYMPLVLGVFAVLAGSGLIVADEESGTLDLVLAHPVSRTALFVGRLLAFVVATLTILALSWLGFVVAMTRFTLEVGGWAMARPYVSLAAELGFFGSLALLLSLVLPARRTAAMATGLILLVSYFLTTLARLDKGLERVARFSPLAYYQGGEALDGLNVRWLAGLLAAAGLFTCLAWWRFERRDVRVVGEGVWRWPRWRNASSSPAGTTEQKSAVHGLLE
jgi:ABC-2 type transport system permease protein